MRSLNSRADTARMNRQPRKERMNASRYPRPPDGRFSRQVSLVVEANDRMIDPWAAFRSDQALHNLSLTLGQCRVDIFYSCQQQNQGLSKNVVRSTAGSS